jgi:hypothetical protein
MEVLNETVYDSDDLEKVVLHAQKKAYERAVAHAIQYNAQQTSASYRQAVPNAPQPLPNQVRFGYYNNPKGDDTGGSGPQQDATVDVLYVSSRGRRYGRGGICRIGIAPPTKLPLNAMQVLALAASDKEQRTLPRQVLGDLVIVLMRTLFHGYAARTDEQEEKWLLNGCPPVRYGFKPDRASAKKSKDLASSDRTERLHQQIKYTEARIERLGKEQTEEQEKLEKLRLRLNKLEAKKEVSLVG